MIGDDDVHAQRLGLGDLCARIDAAVHRDEQLDPGGAEFLDGRRRHPIALTEAVGETPAHVGAEIAQHADQQERRRDAVGVVVAVYRDGLAASQRPVDARACLGHAGHEVRVVHAELGVQEGPRRGGIAEPAAHQHLGQHFAHAEVGCQPPHVGVGSRRDPSGAGVVTGASRGRV